MNRTNSQGDLSVNINSSSGHRAVDNNFDRVMMDLDGNNGDNREPPNDDRDRDLDIRVLLPESKDSKRTLDKNSEPSSKILKKGSSNNSNNISADTSSGPSSSFHSRYPSFLSYSANDRPPFAIFINSENTGEGNLSLHPLSISKSRARVHALKIGRAHV